MKTLLLTSTALFFALATTAGATILSPDDAEKFSSEQSSLIQFADKGKGRGGDDSNDDNSNDVNDDDDNDGSGSGRSKPRIPGGSGCDDPGDVAEHPECTPSNG